MAKNVKQIKTEINPTTGKRDAIILSIIVFATLFVFWNSKNFGFVWDDNEYIVNNPNIVSLSLQSIKHIFSSFYAANYHPITTLSWAIEYHLWGVNPVGYHISNILLHVVNVSLVFFFVQALVKDIRVSAVSTALFAFHPMHVESIVWISERKDLLFTLFYVSSLLCYLQYLRSKKLHFLLLSFIVFIFSCLSKSAAITLPLVLLLLDYYKDSFTLKNIFRKIPFLVVSLLFGILAILSQKSVNAINVNILDFNLLNRFLLLCYSVYYYLFAFFVPIKQSALHFYPQDQSSLSLAYYIAPFILLTLSAFILLYKKHRKELFFGFGFYIVTISLIIQFFPMGSAVVSERYSYVPYIGLAIMFARIAIREIESRKNGKRNLKLAYVIIGFILLVCALKANRRSQVWQNPETLFTDIVDQNPNAYYAYWFRSTARLNDNNYEACISDCNVGLTLNPGYTQFYSVRGMANLNLKNYTETVADLSLYLKYKSDDGNIYFQRGKARRELKDFRGTIQDYEKAIQLTPKLGTAIVYVDMSNLKIAINDFNGSQSDLEKALLLDPNNTEALFNKAVNCFNAKQYNESIACFDKVLQINPNDNEALYNRGMAKATIGDKQGACFDYKRAAALGNTAAQAIANCN